MIKRSASGLLAAIGTPVLSPIFPMVILGYGGVLSLLIFAYFYSREEHGVIVPKWRSGKYLVFALVFGGSMVLISQQAEFSFGGDATIILGEDGEVEEVHPGSLSGHWCTNCFTAPRLLSANTTLNALTKNPKVYKISFGVRAVIRDYTLFLSFCPGAEATDDTTTNPHA